MPRASRQAAIDQSHSKGAARLVLFALLHHANDTARAWPSLNTLERETAMSRQGVLNGIKSLVAAGDVEAQHGGGNWRNEYVIRVGQQEVNVVDLSDDRKGSTSPLVEVHPVGKWSTSWMEGSTRDVARGQSDRPEVNRKPEREQTPERSTRNARARELPVIECPLVPGCRFSGLWTDHLNDHANKGEWPRRQMA